MVKNNLTKLVGNVLINLFERQLQRARDKEHLPLPALLPRWQQQSELGTAKARSLQLLVNLPGGYEGEHLGHYHIHWHLGTTLEVETLRLNLIGMVCQRQWLNLLCHDANAIVGEFLRRILICTLFINIYFSRGLILFFGLPLLSAKLAQSNR